jgi:hypothetical protein
VLAQLCQPSSCSSTLAVVEHLSAFETIMTAIHYNYFFINLNHSVFGTPIWSPLKRILYNIERVAATLRRDSNIESERRTAVALGVEVCINVRDMTDSHNKRLL